MQKIVLASSNIGKLKELQSMLAALPVNIIAQSELGVVDAEETGLTFIENAIIKARHASAITGLPSTHWAVHREFILRATRSCPLTSKDWRSIRLTTPS